MIATGSSPNRPADVPFDAEVVFDSDTQRFSEVPLYSSPVRSQRTLKLMTVGCVSTPSSPRIRVNSG